MKRILPSLLILLFPLAHLTAYSQNLTGIWRGYFITESREEYRFELQIEQKGSAVSGVSYSYHTTDFYGKAILTGNFNKPGHSALIREIKTVELKMDPAYSACIMKCIFQYDRSGKEQFLEGTFTSMFEKNAIGAIKGGNCGSGKIFLRKVPTSDFYIEPFLRNKIKTDSVAIISKPPVSKDSSVIKKTVPLTKTTVKKTSPTIVKKSPDNKKPVPITKTPEKKTTSPVVKKSIPATNKATTSTKTPVKPNTNPAITKTNMPVKLNVDSVKKIDSSPVKKEITKQIFPVPDVIKKRENALVKTLIVNNENIIVKLYDNGVVDGDSISVYFDNKLVLANKGLSEVPLIIKLKIDEENTEHELVMVALNEGRIPPNTSLMLVECGDQRFDVHITSTEQKNAVVRFKYQKPK